MRKQADKIETGDRVSVRGIVYNISKHVFETLHVPAYCTVEDSSIEERGYFRVREIRTGELFRAHRVQLRKKNADVGREFYVCFQRGKDPIRQSISLSVYEVRQSIPKSMSDRQQWRVRVVEEIQPDEL